jgi:single-stranded-DNA-specific exonuclease
MAQKMAQTFGKPTFVFTFEDQWAKGSARSRSGVHLVKLMNQFSHYFVEYGGHEEAGGGKMLREHLPLFAQEIQPMCKEMFGQQAAPETWVDAPLPLDGIHDVFFYGLDRLRPFGMGHPQPIFMADVHVVGQPLQVGQNHLKAKVTDQKGHTFSCIAFGQFEAWRRTFQGPLRIAYKPEKQYFRGKTQISLQILDFQSL